MSQHRRLTRLATALGLGALALGLAAGPATATGAVPAAAGSAAAPAAGLDTPPDTSGLHATVRRTEHGIAHITAADYAGVGYGYGYALAQDTVCVLADTYVTVNAERSRYFGPNASYAFRGNGSTANNLNSDFFYQQIIDAGTIEGLLDQAPPNGPKPEVRELVRGYAAGYNRWLAEIGGADGITDPACRGAAWVRPITEIDVYRRFYQLALLASSGAAIDGIGSAQPPTPSTPVPSQPSTDAAAAALRGAFSDLGIGSNAVAVGSAGSRNGRGVLLGNPHFPWIGSERFWQAQLTIPGQLDVTGGSLLGVPLVLIGHTATMAWSHTVSTAYRFTPYELTLVPGSPTTYLVDGRPTAMTSRTVTVQARQADGSLAPRSRTLYSSRYGPMFTSILGQSLFPWTPARAFSMRDANAANFRYVNHFLETNRARSAAEELQVLERNQGIPWVNTIVADDSGQALYADISVTPHVTDAQAQQCDTELGAATFRLLRLPVLDGSRTACDWGSDPDAVQPGTFGPGNQPHLFRNDYVTNSNDSYWLSNPAEPLTGYARIIGDERTARTLRTRLGLLMTAQRIAGTDGEPGPPGFDRVTMQDMVFNDRQYAGELTAAAAAAMCRSFAGGLAPTSSGTPVPVRNACDVLAAWDRHDDLDSAGALLFRRFWGHAAGATPSPWVNPFDPANPVTTPNTLDTSNPQVRAAVGDAINDLDAAGIPLDAPLRGYQYETRGEEQIPIHGGPGTLGVFNAINVGLNTAKGGYVNVPHGSSFVQSVAFDGSGCPDAGTILTYSQSPDPTSPWYADQTRLFSQKQWVPDRFCEADIAASPVLTTTVIDAADAPQPSVPEVPAAVLLPLAAAGAGLAVLGRRRRTA